MAPVISCPPERWVATLIKGLWDVAWDQWEYRNAILHSPLHRAHGLLTHSLDTAIIQEHIRGSSDLPPSYSELFQISLPSHSLSAALAAQC